MARLRATAAATGCVAGLLAASVLGYAALYGSNLYVWPLAAAGAVALLGAWLSALWLIAVDQVRGRLLLALAHLGWLLVTTIIVWFAVQPDRASFDLAGDIGHSVSRILTLNQPVDVANDVIMLPFLVTAVAGYLAGLAVRTSSPLLPLVPPAVALIVQLLLCAGAGPPVLTTACMVIFAGSAVVLAWLRRRQTRPGGTAVAALTGRVIARLGALVVLVALVASGGAVALGRFDHDRVDPRDRWQADHLVRPEVTPLALLKSEITGPDVPRFTVELVTGGAGTPRAERLDRLAVATLSDYDGSSWTASTQFRKAGVVLQRSSGSPDRAVRVRVDVTTLPGRLLPTVARPLRMQPASASRSYAVDFDRESAMVRAASDPTGWHYLADGLTGAATADPLTRAERQRYTELSKKVRDQAAKLPGLIRGSSPGRLELSALERRMRETLPYSPDAPAGNSLAAIRRVLGGTAPGNGGYAEQDAAAFSLLARMAGLPSRIAVGYLLAEPLSPNTSGPVQVTSHDAYAWSEVYLDHDGWVAFDPTDTTKRPTPYPAGPDAGSPPPSTATRQPVKPSARPTPVTNPSPEPDAPVWQPLRAALPVVLVIEVLLALAVVGLALARAVTAMRRRRAQRRDRDELLRFRRSGTPAERVLGAWAELRDLLGRRYQLPACPSLTPDEVKEMAHGVVPDPDDAVPHLASLVNATLFDRVEPGPGDAERAWLLLVELQAAPVPPERARLRSVPEGVHQ